MKKEFNIEGRILGIESSCDETAAAVVEKGRGDRPLLVKTYSKILGVLLTMTWVSGDDAIFSL